MEGDKRYTELIVNTNDRLIRYNCWYRLYSLGYSLNLALFLLASIAKWKWRKLIKHSKRWENKSIEEKEELLRLQEIVQEIAKYENMEKEQIIDNPNIQVIGRISREIQNRNPMLGDIVIANSSTQILPSNEIRGFGLIIYSISKSKSKEFRCKYSKI